MLKKKNILKIGISDATKSDILEYILKGLEKPARKYFIVTPNPEILMLANKDLRYKKILNSAKLALPDGVGVMIAGRIMKGGFKQRIPGVDLVENLCKTIAGKPITVGFLGGGYGIAEKTAECLKRKYPGLKVTFAASEYSDLARETRKIRKSEIQIVRNFEIRNFRRSDSPSFPSIPKTDILFVAFGSPKQEIWIYENLDKLPVKVAIGVGGAFDFLSGKVKRAPLWIQKAGFEWLFRLINQPWRAKRQLALIKFIFLVLKERFNLK